MYFRILMFSLGRLSRCSVWPSLLELNTRSPIDAQIPILTLSSPCSSLSDTWLRIVFL
uniref:Uncharacterized protein n=1 Tax=Arundo donax TaxID=35708 RepID=A0A0A8Z333_ARUDO